MALISVDYFDQSYVVPKQIAVYGLICLFALFVRWRDEFSYSKPFLFLLAAGVLSLVRTTMFQPENAMPFILDRLGWVVLMLSWAHLHRRPDGYLFKSALLILCAAISVFGIVQYREIGGTGQIPYDFFGSTFGHANFAAEGLGFLFLMALIPMATKNKANTIGFRTLVLSTSVVVMTYLILTRCRSVWLGGAVAFVFYLYQRFKINFKWVAVAFLFCVIALFALKSLMFTGDWSVEKYNNAMFRLSLWQGSLKMFIEHPLGIGFGRFAFNFIPYQLATAATVTENSVVASPHNEFLRILVEDGPVYLGSLLWFVWSTFRGATLDVPERRWVLALFAFLVVQMFFNFPLENAIPYLFSAWFMGFLWSRRQSQSHSQTHAPQGSAGRLLIFERRFEPWSCALVLWALSGLYINSQIQYAMSEDEYTGRYIKSCRSWPSFTQGCIRAANEDLQNAKNGDVRAFDHGSNLLNQLIIKSPYLFPAIDLKAEFHILRGEVDQTCDAWRAHGAIIGSESTLGRLVDTECPPPRIKNTDYLNFYTNKNNI